MLISDKLKPKRKLKHQHTSSVLLKKFLDRVNKDFDEANWRQFLGKRVMRVQQQLERI